MPCHPQSALAGLNARPRVAAFGVSTPRAALTARSRAMCARESGQIRKEAALSGSGHVPRIRLARASHDGNARGPLSKAGRTVLPDLGGRAAPRRIRGPREPPAPAWPPACGATEAVRSRRRARRSGAACPTTRCRPSPASAWGREGAAACRARSGTCACRRLGPDARAWPECDSRRDGGGFLGHAQDRRSTRPSARAESAGPAGAPPLRWRAAISFQVPPLARLGTMSVARPIGCSPFRAWTGSVEYPSVMKMS